MSSRRVFLSSALALCAALATTATTSGAAAPCREGYARGDWDLPANSTTPGFLDGILYLTSPTPTPSPVPVYTIWGTLTDTPSPCLSCIQGDVDAYLDDGFGPAPDYIVRGTYSGLWLSGKGTWKAEIYTPTGIAPVGKISGAFSDPPGTFAIGEFKAEWKICP